jgi:hypothetical protein
LTSNGDRAYKYSSSGESPHLQPAPGFMPGALPNPGGIMKIEVHPEILKTILEFIGKTRPHDLYEMGFCGNEVRNITSFYHEKKVLFNDITNDVDDLSDKIEELEEKIAVLDKAVYRALNPNP